MSSANLKIAGGFLVAIVCIVAAVLIPASKDVLLDLAKSALVFSGGVATGTVAFSRPGDARVEGVHVDDLRGQ